eukprot:271620_1
MNKLIIFSMAAIYLCLRGINGWAISCGLRECIGQQITCPQGEDCTVDCRDWFACQNADITCPSGPYTCTLQCRNVGACWNAEIQGSTDQRYGTLIVKDVYDNGSIKGLTIICPQNGDCKMIR